ncbi:MAG: BolA protein [Alphaproteobacteria bacterium]|jgi:BolA protein
MTDTSPSPPGSVAATMQAKLQEAFAPARLVLTDESHLHAGHAGAREGGESHFRLEIVAEAFTGLSRLDCQRRIYAVLTDELAGPVHALSITARPSI